LIGAAAAVAAAGIFVTTRPDPGPPRTAPTPEPTSSPRAPSPEALLLARKNEIVRVDVSTGEEVVVAEVPTPSVYAAPLTRWIAYVTSSPEDDDFASDPELFLYDPASRRATSAGPGFAPVWNADGTRLAFLRPVEPRDCFGEECAGAVVVGIVEPGTGRESTALEPGRYSILGWAGQRVLASDFDDTSRVVAAPADGDATFLDVRPSELWEASPDGRWLLAETEAGTGFLSLDGGSLGDGAVPVDLGGRALLEAKWSPDSARVAALVTDPGSPAVRHEIVVFSPDDPRATVVDGTRGALGGAVWSPDGRTIAFTGAERGTESRLTAVVCELEGGDPCGTFASWRSGVTILRLE
jgi:Tol biopolymer transport system component